MLDTNSNYYEILGISPNASKPEIKKAFFELSKQWHPDVCKKPNAIKKFQTINQAYQTLYDDESRAAYDKFLKQGLQEGISFDEYNNDYSYFDVTVLNQYMNCPFDKQKLDKLFDNLSDDQICFLYEYFWVSFWSGSYLSELLLSNKSLQDFFLYFYNNHHDVINECKKNLWEKIKTEKDNEIHKNSNTAINNLRTSLDSILNEFDSNEFNQSTRVDYYNMMITIINEDNCFDCEFNAFFAFDHADEIIKLFNWFEMIYDNCKDLKNISMRSAGNDKFSKKKTAAISTMVVVIIIVAAIIFFAFF